MILALALLPALALALLPALGFALGATTMASSTAQAADAKGGLRPELVDRLQNLELGGVEKAMADVVANGDLKSVALNRERYIAHSPLINHRIKKGGITAQRGSGRCWMFAGFNVLRPVVMERFDLKDFEFSENFLLFWDKMEKSNLFLQGMIDRADEPLDERRLANLLDDPLGDGGWWTYFTDLVEKYGAVPIETMPESHNSSSTGQMNSLLTLKLKQLGLELREMSRQGARSSALESRKEEMLGELYRMLVFNLGRPPREFTWRYETRDSTSIATYPRPLTPHEFVEEAVGLDLGAYVSLFNYPGKEYGRTYSLEMSRNLYDRPDFTTLNLPMDSLRACVLRSLLDSTAVWFACDVGQENYGKDGILALDIYNYEEVYGTRFDLPRMDLIQLGLITPNHAMTFVGVDTLGTKPVKWLVENSWGEDAGDKGLWYMYDDWFDRYMFGAVIHQRYLSPELLEQSRLDPIVLPPWDPMYPLCRLK